MRLALAVALAVLAVAVPALGAHTSTGLHGHVSRGPITPVCQEGTPCSAPAKHVTLFFTRGSVTRTTVTTLDGSYSITLAAGTYAVHVMTGKGTIAPRTVTVVARRNLARNFSIDTGIR